MDNFIHERQADGSWLLETECHLERPIDDVFEFFQDAYNLERLTPPFLKFEVLTPKPIPMASGTLIDYRLRLHGIPIRWRTEIQDWNPPHEFVDTQLKGPYRLWHHTHTFTEKNGGTLCVDRVRYRSPGGSLIHRFFVGPDVERIFRYRSEQLLEIFSREA